MYRFRLRSGIVLSESASDETDESDEDTFWQPRHRMRANKIVKPDKELVESLQRSDFAFMTRQGLGMVADPEEPVAKPPKLPRLIAQREARTSLNERKPNLMSPDAPLF